MGRAKNKAPDTIFLPCQTAWVKDQSRLKIAEKSRQVGFTWATAYADMRGLSSISNQHDYWITSRDKLQAQIYIQDCLAWGELLGIVANDMGEQILDDVNGRKQSAQVLRAANGRCLYSLSSNPNAQAGKRGYRRADEFALNANPKFLYGIMYPGITWSGNMWIWSTHRGTQNYFNQLIQEVKFGGNPKNFSLHTITLESALAEGLLDKLQSKWPDDDPRQEYDESDYFDSVRRECPDEETFLQEYMCRPSDDEGAYISYDLIDKCVYTPGAEWECPINPDAQYFIGFDVARTSDLSVIWIAEKNNDQRLTRRIIEMRNTMFDEQERVLYSYLDMPCVKRCCIDASGLGRQLAERAKQRYGHKVEPVVFTAAVKEDLAVTTRRTMEDSMIKIPDKREVIADLRSIRKETTSAGNIRYVGDRTTNGHADRFWALALCLHAAKPHGYVAKPATLSLIPSKILTNP